MSRPKGYADWSPSPETLLVLAQVREVLAEYGSYGPMTARQIFYRLVAHPGPVLLSGYANPLYDRALGAWTRETTRAYAQGNREREEVLWINRRPGTRWAAACSHPTPPDLRAIVPNKPQPTRGKGGRRMAHV